MSNGKMIGTEMEPGDAERFDLFYRHHMGLVNHIAEAVASGLAKHGDLVAGLVDPRDPAWHFLTREIRGDVPPNAAAIGFCLTVEHAMATIRTAVDAEHAGPICRSLELPLPEPWCPLVVFGAGGLSVCLLKVAAPPWADVEMLN